MNVTPAGTHRLSQAVMGAAVLAGLYVVSRYNYQLFHGVAELFAVAVAWSVFFLVWNTRRLVRNDALLFLGIAFFFVGFVDIVHALSHKGMGIFADDLASNRVTQLWIAARGVEAVSLVLFPLLLGRRLQAWPVLWGYAGVTALLMGLIFAWDVFPDCYVESRGLTGFSIGAEFAICLLLVLGIGLLFKRRERLDATVWRPMIGAMAVSIAAELAFTLHTDAHGLSNHFGHLLKTVSFLLIYQALVRSAVIQPHVTLLGDLAQAKDALANEGRQLQLLHQVASLFPNSETLEDTLADLPALIAAHYQVPSVAIELYDADRQEMVFVGTVGIPKAKGGNLRVPVDRTVSGTVATSGRSVVELDVSVHAEYRSEALREIHAVTFACVPLMGQEGVIGTLSVADRKKRPDILDETDLLQALADSVAQEIERRQAETRLRASEKKFRSVVEQATDAIFVTTPRGRFIDVNQRACELLGYTREELLEQNVGDIDPRYARAESLANALDTVMAEGHVSLESVHHRKDGSTFPAEVSFGPMQLEGETYVIALVRDISERKQAEEETRKFKTITDETITGSAITGSAITDMQQNFLYVDAALAEAHGYTKEELAGHTLSVFHTEAQMEAVGRIKDAIMETGRFGPAEIWHVHRDGHEFPMLMSVVLVRDEWGDPRYVAASAVDLSDIKEAEAALRRSEEKYRELVENANSVILRMDTEGKVTFFNTFAQQFFGFSEDEIVGRTVVGTIVPETESTGRDLAAMIRSIVRSPHEYATNENENVRKDGRRVWVAWTNKAVLDTQGRVCEILCVGNDISQRKQTEDALKKRMIALTRPLDHAEGVTFEDLFRLEDIQRLQDQFAKATEVASIITRTDGTPITNPSNFCRLCNEIIRKTDTGLANCLRSDAMLGRRKLDGPTIQPCLSGGLWDAGAAITVGGKHIANWLIGQVRDETQTEEEIRAYVRAIGGDEEATAEAFHEVTAMSREKFAEVAQTLYTLAAQLSDSAYQNVQQARFITDLKRLEEERRQGEETYRNLLNSLNAGVVVHAPDTSVLLTNPAAAGVLGLSEDQICGKQAMDPQWKFLREDGSDMPLDEYPVNRVVSTNRPLHNLVVGVNRPQMGDTAWVLVSGFPVHRDSGQLEQVVINFVDITDRKQAETDKEKLESQLRQAQKIDAVGRLAGGVAHDFNNMLSVILGHAEMTLEQMDPNQPFRADLMEIKKAAERSADLTRQLLAFARKQTVAPEVLDLNKSVAGMTKMLQRLIGEDIDLAWLPGEKLWPVKIDPGQVDQVLANMCVNARDAIADVGKVTVETDNTAFDKAYCDDHPGVAPGEYVMLAVSDNGCGMDAETLDHLFDPFFTTKEQGKGTGLGMATVYGIVKQNNGFVHVHSEPGQGTAIKIYLPRHAAKVAPLQDEGPDKPHERGHETILLVEDEPAILRMTTMMLKRLGYTVAAAGTPSEAIQLAHAHSGELHLLMTDVVMPDMNGRDLAKNILTHYPKLKRLFMSGYTADVITQHGVLDPGVNFIQKPFSMESLGVKVREALDGE